MLKKILLSFLGLLAFVALASVEVLASDIKAGYVETLPVGYVDVICDQPNHRHDVAIQRVAEARDPIIGRTVGFAATSMSTVLVARVMEGGVASSASSKAMIIS